MTPSGLIEFARSFPDAILLVGTDGTVLLANQAALQLSGLDQQAVIGMPLQRLVSEPPQQVRELLRRYARSGRPLPGALTFRGAESYIQCRCHGWLIQSSTPDVKPVICIRAVSRIPANNQFHTLNLRIEELTRETSARKRSDGLLNGQKRALELVAQGACLGEVLHLLTCVVEQLSANGVLASILLLERDSNRLRHGAAPSLPEEYQRAIDGLEIGPQAGSCGTAAYSAEPVVVEDIQSSPLWAEFREIAERFGLRACWSTPIVSSHGRVLGTFAMYYRQPCKPNSRDWQMVDMVTRTAAIAIEKARSEADRRDQEETLRRAEKLAAAGRLAATIAHEINNPLEAVTNLIYLAVNHGGIPGEVKDQLKSAEYELSRVAHITRQTLGFYRNPAVPAWAEADRLIEDVLVLYRSKLQSKNIRVERSYQSGVSVHCWPGEMRQVLANLVGNAIDSMSSGGVLRVGLLADGNEHVTITVSDNGSGIKAETLPHLFEPFFTTKRDVGTGLGLWIAKEIVDKHRGTIAVESSSEPGHSGTTFRLNLPVNCELMPSSLAA